MKLNPVWVYELPKTKACFKPEKPAHLVVAAQVALEADCRDKIGEAAAPAARGRTCVAGFMLISGPEVRVDVEHYSDVKEQTIGEGRVGSL